MTPNRIGLGKGSMPSIVRLFFALTIIAGSFQNLFAESVIFQEKGIAEQVGVKGQAQPHPISKENPAPSWINSPKTWVLTAMGVLVAGSILWAYETSSQMDQAAPPSGLGKPPGDPVVQGAK